MTNAIPKYCDENVIIRYFIVPSITGFCIRAYLYVQITISRTLFLYEIEYLYVRTNSKMRTEPCQPGRLIFEAKITQKSHKIGV